MGFKDLFSAQSSQYAEFRPRYPEGLFEELARLVPGHELVWDVGTGSGQAAGALARRFTTVVATDPSQKQLESASAHAGVVYALGGAERAPLADRSVDLVTAAQAFHWFDQPAFFRECRRVLKPRGVVAIWCYDLCEISPEVDAVVRELYEDVLGPFWDPERRQVEQGYARAEFPFEAIPLAPLVMREARGFEQFIGYLGTWSAIQKYMKRHDGENPLERIAPRIKAVWGSARERELRWHLSVRAGHV